MMRYLLPVTLLVGLTLTVAAHGQQQFPNTTGTFGAQNPGGNITSTSTGRLSGFSQSGQLTGSAASTEASGFVGASTTAGTSNNFLSQSGTTGVGGFNSLGGLGLGGGGFGTGNNVLGQAALLGGLGGGFGQGRFGQTGQQNQLNNTPGQATVRTTLRAGFTVPSPPAPVIATRFERRLANMRQIRSVGPIRVTLIGEQAILEGVVESEHARSLAERVALLEPGISQIQNDLTIGTPVLEPEDFPLLP